VKIDRDRSVWTKWYICETLRVLFCGEKNWETSRTRQWSTQKKWRKACQEACRFVMGWKDKRLWVWRDSRCVAALFSLSSWPITNWGASLGNRAETFVLFMLRIYLYLLLGPLNVPLWLNFLFLSPLSLPFTRPKCPLFFLYAYPFWVWWTSISFVGALRTGHPVSKTVL